MNFSFNLKRFHYIVHSYFSNEDNSDEKGREDWKMKTRSCLSHEVWLHATHLINVSFHSKIKLVLTSNHCLDEWWYAFLEFVITGYFFKCLFDSCAIICNTVSGPFWSSQGYSQLVLWELFYAWPSCCASTERRVVMRSIKNDLKILLGFLLNS